MNKIGLVFNQGFTYLIVHNLPLWATTASKGVLSCWAAVRYVKIQACRLTGCCLSKEDLVLWADHMVLTVSLTTIPGSIDAGAEIEEE